MGHLAQQVALVIDDHDVARRFTVNFTLVQQVLGFFPSRSELVVVCRRFGAQAQLVGAIVTLAFDDATHGGKRRWAQCARLGAAANDIVIEDGAFD
ncbi:hypothetical protein D3C76_1308770 [compost metagenome]